MGKKDNLAQFCESSEYTPLVGARKRTTSKGSDSGINSNSVTLNKSLEESWRCGNADRIGFERHITLMDCIVIIIGNVVGSGIFISPKAVVMYAGSTGATLCIWAAMGLLALVQALCYAELGCVIPKAGGDYAYIYDILGPLPAFVAAWTHIMVVTPSAAAVIGRTAALYFAQAVKVTCHDLIATLLSIFIIISFAIINSISSKLAIRVQAVFSVAKVFSLVMIIATGIGMFAKGHVENFAPDKVWKDTTWSPGRFAVGALDAYFAYKGWELVNTLPEEMVNPKRDLPRSVLISMVLAAVMNLLVNVSFFTILSPAQFLASDAVGLTFMTATIGPVATWVLMISVILCCAGTVNGSFISDTKYLFAAGRYKQLPGLFAMIQIKYLTPVAAIFALCVMGVIYSLIPHVETLAGLTGVAVNLKIMMGIISLLVLRYKQPDLPRPVKMPLPIVVGVLVVMLAMFACCLLEEPLTMGIGFAVFLSGIPLFYIGEWVKHKKPVVTAMAKLTVVSQKAFMMVPETTEEDIGPLTIQ